MAISASKRREIEKLARAGGSSRAIARKVGLHDTTVLRYMPADCKRKNARQAAAAKPKPGRMDDLSKDSWQISFPGTRICTVEQMIAHCKIDLSVWEVERFVCNKWEVGAADKRDGQLRGIVVEPLFQVKLWLKRKAAQLAIRVEVEQLKAEAARFAPKFPRALLRFPRARYSSGNWVEHAIFDHHFGALIWGKETGRDDYDLGIAKKNWHDAIAHNCARTDAYSPEGALFVIGNDQQNADNRAGDTEKGTRQAMDGRYQKVYGVSRDATVWAVDQFLARYARVHVVVVGGNHDPLASFHLGDYLGAWYRHHKRVTVDNGPAFRKWWEHGIVGLGYCHGNAGKLEQYGMKMAAEQPAMWGRTLWREMHTGDKHHERTHDYDGYTVRILPSLRPPCAWSAENGYGARRAAESFVWSRSEGLVGTSIYSILPGRLSAGQSGRP